MVLEKIMYFHSMDRDTEAQNDKGSWWLMEQSSKRSRGWHTRATVPNPIGWDTLFSIIHNDAQKISFFPSEECLWCFCKVLEAQRWGSRGTGGTGTRRWEYWNKLLRVLE